MHFATNFKSGAISVLTSLVVLSALSVVSFFLLFGTYISHPELLGLPQPVDASSFWYFGSGLLHTLTKQAILDNVCAGSNVWVYVCLHMIPSLIIFVKIWT
jgi:hypothetical protein